MKKTTYWIFVSVVLLVWIGYSFLSLFLSIRSAQIGFSHIKQAQTDDINRVVFELLEAQKYIAKADSRKKFTSWLSIIPDIAFYHQIISGTDNLLTVFSDSIYKIADENINQLIDARNFDYEQAGPILLEALPEIQEGIARLNFAQDLKDSLNLNLYPDNVRAQVQEGLDILDELEESQQQISEFIPLLNELLGHNDPHEILILLQNSDELRPTGGFIGNYARLSIDNGLLKQFYTEDIYTIDRSYAEQANILAPEPVRKYSNVEYFFLRDANWSPDYPTSAKTVRQLYLNESGETDIDTVIAITPFLIEDIMSVIGPVEVDGQVFTSQTITDTLQDVVERDFSEFGYTREERKEIVNKLAQSLKQKFFNLSFEEMLDVKNVVLNSLNQKDVLVYSELPKVYNYILERNWNGAVPNVNSDFVFAVDTNLGALKTDRVLQRSQTYQVEQQTDGTWKGNLTLQYQHNGGFDYKTTRYRSWVRVYVPLGSTLKQWFGYMSDDKVYDNPRPQTYSEFGKTVFAGFVSIEPGRTQTLNLQYDLPNDLPSYELLAHKQPGLENALFNFQIKSLQPLYSYAPAASNYRLEAPNHLISTIPFDQDTEIVVKFGP